ncbi:hypothetical protein DERF_006928 [Dermatophagoides farinae]|uniref:Uncharacterized protein n=1 Tax=Dermatophagoides farinae TaxID=6954 RepID=A0A922HY25_DERFA|nr:hypothetical protein DERF_006928 [Dermatophagoides farinae]
MPTNQCLIVSGTMKDGRYGLYRVRLNFFAVALLTHLNTMLCLTSVILHGGNILRICNVSQNLALRTLNLLCSQADGQLKT